MAQVYNAKVEGIILRRNGTGTQWLNSFIYRPFPPLHRYTFAPVCHFS
jgi:hypothetical protein